MTPTDLADGTLVKLVGLAVYVVKRVVRSATDRWVAITIIVCATACAIVFLARIPDSELNHLSLSDMIQKISDAAGAGWVCVSGWALCAITMFGAYIIVQVQHRRIKSQGAQLTMYRNKDDPRRLSAGNMSDLRTYAERAKSQFDNREPRR
jgi:hypothetical protein